MKKAMPLTMNWKTVAKFVQRFIGDFSEFRDVLWLNMFSIYLLFSST